uniref:Uncharacterized protein n=1 Tax=Steinernema glaseri TaxID=37863 RepID=A0A1I7Z3A5_9BILA
MEEGGKQEGSAPSRRALSTQKDFCLRMSYHRGETQGPALIRVSRSTRRRIFSKMSAESSEVSKRTGSEGVGMKNLAMRRWTISLRDIRSERKRRCEPKSGIRPTLAKKEETVIHQCRTILHISEADFY